MKKRTGFVSNSSSSSFVCCICYNTNGGMDISLSDIGFVEDELHYTYCEDHLDIDDVLAYCKKNKDTLNLDENIYHHQSEYSIFDEMEYQDKTGKPYSDEDKDLYNSFMYSYRDNIPKELSPIYNLKTLPDTIMLKYLMKKYKFTNVKEVMVNLKNSCPTYEKLVKHLELNKHLTEETKYEEED